MAIALNQCTTLAQLQTYARDGSVDAVKACPYSAEIYDDALMAALKGEAFASVKARLVVADSACHNEAIASGKLTSKSTSSTGGSANVVIASSSDTPIWVWLLAAGGVGIGLWLLFGKGRKGRKR